MNSRNSTVQGSRDPLLPGDQDLPSRLRRPPEPVRNRAPGVHPTPSFAQSTLVGPRVGRLDVAGGVGRAGLAAEPLAVGGGSSRIEWDRHPGTGAHRLPRRRPTPELTTADRE